MTRPRWTCPRDPAVGFLPPDAHDPNGSGSVNYTVAAKSGLATGTTISANASIVFDYNAAISTGNYVNTIDASAASTVVALPATSPTSFNLSWNGTDAGSGIATYTVYVSDNSGPFTALLSNTTTTSTTFMGVVGHSYGFCTVATDNVGNLQPTPTSAQATTAVRTTTIFSGLSASSSIVYGTASITVSGIISAGGGFPPNNEMVAVTLNGQTVNAVIGNNGTFSATLNTSSLPASATPYSVKYAYAGDATYGAATDQSTTSVTVTKASSTVTISANNGPNPSDATQSVSLAVAITGPIPDGETVTLKDGSNGNVVVGSGTLSGGLVTITIPVGTIFAGTHNLFAVYAGDANFTGSQSATVAQVVQVVATAVKVNGNIANLAGAAFEGRQHSVHL